MKEFRIAPKDRASSRSLPTHSRHVGGAPSAVPRSCLEFQFVAHAAVSSDAALSSRSRSLVGGGAAELPLSRRVAIAGRRLLSGGDAVPPLAAALARRTYPFARPGTHERLLAPQTLAMFALIDAIGLGLLVRFVRHQKLLQMKEPTTVDCARLQDGKEKTVAK